MKVMSATDFKKRFGAALDVAQREAVFIRKQNGVVAVLLPVQDFEKLCGLRIMKKLGRHAERIRQTPKDRARVEKEASLAEGLPEPPVEPYEIEEWG